MRNYRQLLKNINVMIFDYDGVLNDGRVFLIKDDEPLRTIHVKDGYALQHAVKQGMQIIIMSGGKSENVRTRLQKIGITHIYLGIQNKLEFFEKFKNEHGILNDNILYMGDDIPDYPVMTQVALPVCPLDAAEEIKQISKYISSKVGGAGCVRDIIEQVLKVQGKWMNEHSYIW